MRFALITITKAMIGGGEMEKENYITENIHSKNVFVSQLYSELEERVKAFENHDEDSRIQRVTLSTAILPLITVSLITAYMLYITL